MAWHVYVIRCGDGTLYTGIARDVAARFAQHASGKGARYTRGRSPLTIELIEPVASQGDALRREAAIRRLGRAGKEALIAISERPAHPGPAAPRRSSRSRRAAGS